MNPVQPSKIDSLLSEHYTAMATRWNVRSQAHIFRRNGFLLLRDVVPDSVRAEVLQ